MHNTTQEIPFKLLPKEKLQDIKTYTAYDLCYMESRRVFNDSTFSFDSQRYSVPPMYIGKTVTVKYRPSMARIDVYYGEKCITQHRTDSLDKYVIKRSHRYEIWRLWRGEKKLFYQNQHPKQNENHPLELYEQISMMEHKNGQPATA